MPQPISSSLISRDVMNAEDSQCVHHLQNEEMCSGFKEGRMQ